MYLSPDQREGPKPVILEEKVYPPRSGRPPRRRPVRQDTSIFSPNQLQIVRLICNRPIPKLTNNLRPLQKKETLHLLAIFFDRPNPMFEERTLKPPSPNRRLQQRQRRMNSRQRKHRTPIDPRLRVADPLDITNPVILKEGLRALRRPQMHKHRSHPSPSQLLTKLRDIADRLTAKRTPKVPQKNQQHRRSLYQLQQARTRLRMDRSKRLRHIFG